MDSSGSAIYIGDEGKRVDVDKQMPIYVEADYKQALLANLYSTVEFLRKEIEEKNFLIRELLKRDKSNQLSVGKNNNQSINGSLKMILIQPGLKVMTAFHLVKPLMKYVIVMMSQKIIQIQMKIWYHSCMTSGRNAMQHIRGSFALSVIREAKEIIKITAAIRKMEMMCLSYPIQL